MLVSKGKEGLKRREDHIKKILFDKLTEPTRIKLKLSESEPFLHRSLWSPVGLGC